MTDTDKPRFRPVSAGGFAADRLTDADGITYRRFEPVAKFIHEWPCAICGEPHNHLFVDACTSCVVAAQEPGYG